MFCRPAIEIINMQYYQILKIVNERKKLIVCVIKCLHCARQL